MNTPKVDDISLETFVIIINLSKIENKARKFRFLNKTILLTWLNMNIIFNMLFYILNNMKKYFL